MKTNHKIETLREITSQKYDNELNIYKLIAYETILLKSKVLREYTFNLDKKYSKISFSIKRTIEKIEKIFES